MRDDEAAEVKSFMGAMVSSVAIIGALTTKCLGSSLPDSSFNFGCSGALDSGREGG